MRFNRRDFLAGTAALLPLGAAQAAPAESSPLPTIRWRLASSFPKSLDTIYGAAETLSKRVAALTGGKFQIRVFAGGELVPGLQVLDAVGNGTAECGHSAGYYYVGKNLALAFDTAVPFGLTARQQNAWMYAGGGLEAAAQAVRQIQRAAVSRRQHRHPDGRLVPQGNQVAGRPARA